ILLAAILFFSTFKQTYAQITGDLYFDGQTSEVTVQNNPGLQLSSNGFTVEVWFNACATSTQNQYNAMVTKWYSSIQEASELGLNNGQPYFKLGSTYFNTTGGADLRDSKWHHLALSYSNSMLIFYVDGLTIYSINSVTIPNITAGGPLQFGRGAYSTSQDRFAGYISEFRLWSSPLTNAQI